MNSRGQKPHGLEARGRHWYPAPPLSALEKAYSIEPRAQVEAASLSAPTLIPHRAVVTGAHGLTWISMWLLDIQALILIRTSGVLGHRIIFEAPK